MKIVTVVSVSCWGVLLEFIYSHVEAAINIIRNLSNMMHEDKKSLKTHKEKFLTLSVPIPDEERKLPLIFISHFFVVPQKVL